MSFITVLNQIIVLFLLIIVGYVGRKLNIFSDKGTKELSAILLKLTLPALIISSMQKAFTLELLKESGQILLMSFAIYGLAFLFTVISPYVLKAPKKDMGIYQYMMIFSNVGFMGYPVLEAVFGSDSLFYGAIYNLPFNFLVFTLGIYFIMQGKDEEHSFRWTVLINPGVIAVFVGFFFFIFSIKLPGPVGETVKMIGDLTTPLSMIIVGAILSNIDVKQMFGGWRIYSICLFRLLLFPLVVWGILQFFIKDPLLLGIPVIISAMPVAANTALMAEEYESNAELASKGVFISTLFSIISIPLLAYFVV